MIPNYEFSSSHNDKDSGTGSRNEAISSSSINEMCTSLPSDCTYNNSNSSNYSCQLNTNRSTADTKYLSQEHNAVLDTRCITKSGAKFCHECIELEEINNVHKPDNGSTPKFIESNECDNNNSDTFTPISDPLYARLRLPHFTENGYVDKRVFES